MRRLMVVLVVAAGLGWGLLQLPAVQDRLVDLAIHQRLDPSGPQALFADDALRLLVCGSASPFPAPDRARPCLAVIADGKFYIVDTGPGSWNRIALLRIPGERIGGVFLSHFHSDHVGDLGEFNLQTWIAGRPEPLPVFGPAGVERVVAGYTESYALDTDYRIAHHGAQMLDRSRGEMRAIPVVTPAAGTAVEILRAGDLRVSVFAVSHEPIDPAVGYRFDYRGRSIAISGDTRKDPSIARAAAGVDVLAHEAQNQELVARIGHIAAELDYPRYAKVMADIPDYHTSPVEAAELANAAGAELLLLYHLTPPPPNRIAEKAFLRGVSAVRDAGVALAHDGTLVELPLAGGAPTIRRIQ